jgi:aconitate decarboxylase
VTNEEENMHGLTESLAQFVSTGVAAIPPQAAHIIKTGFIDTTATILAGRDEPVVGIVRQFVAARGASAREASVLFGAEQAAAADAALINATAGHALDYDDVALGGHPSTVLVPAILAEGERLGSSGDAALHAYLVGYEVWAELLAREPDAYHSKGWHPTAVMGTVAVAAACARLRDLPAPVCRNALAIAASLAGGLVANFGTMTKPLHAGRAASCGIEAVALAAAGLTASADALEHNAGFLSALSPQGRADRASPAANLGKALRILETGLSIKKYPMCYATHRVIDGVLDLVDAHDLQPAQVAGARATIGVAQASMLRNHAPATGLEAKFSLEFAVAAALVARKVGLQELSDQFVNQAPLRAAMSKVNTEVVDTRCPLEPAFSYSDRVVLELADGRKLDSGEIRFARGNAKLPLKDSELKSKFFDCAKKTAALSSEALYENLSRLETCASLRTLSA